MTEYTVPDVVQEDPDKLLDWLRFKGITLSLTDQETIALKFTGELPAAWRDAIKAQKSALLELLAAEQGQPTSSTAPKPPEPKAKVQDAPPSYSDAPESYGEPRRGPLTGKVGSEYLEGFKAARIGSERKPLPNWMTQTETWDPKANRALLKQTTDQIAQSYQELVSCGVPAEQRRTLVERVWQDSGLWMEAWTRKDPEALAARLLAWASACQRMFHATAVHQTASTGLQAQGNPGVSAVLKLATA
jgi:hypothetical protein